MSAVVIASGEFQSNPNKIQRDKQAHRQAGWAVLPAVLMVYSILLPPEVHIVLAGQNLYAYRLAIILLLPWVLSASLKNSNTWKLADGLFLVGGLWMILSFVAIYDVADGLVRGGALAADVIVPYFVARLSLRSFDDLRRFLIYLAPGLAFVAAILALESITHTPMIRRAAAGIFGQLSGYENGVASGVTREVNDFRFGLLRASGPFPFSILGGLFLASFLPLYLIGGIRGWPKVAGLLAIAGGFFTISTAVFLSVLMQLALIVIDYAQKIISAFKWKNFLILLAMFIAIIQVSTQNGLISIVVRLSLNNWTAYYRTLIWKYGIISVKNNPIFGIGFYEYDRPGWMTDSIDAHWLLWAVRHGFLLPVLLLMTVFMAVYGLANGSGCLAVRDRNIARATAISIAVFVISGFTVAYFGGIVCWLSMLIGMGTSLASAVKAQSFSTISRSKKNSR